MRASSEGTIDRMPRDTVRHVTRALLGGIAMGVFAALSLGVTPVAAQSSGPQSSGPQSSGPGTVTPFLASAAGPVVTVAGGDLAPDALVTLVVRSRAFAGTRTVVTQTDGAGHVRAAALVCSRIAALALEATVMDEAGTTATTAFIAPSCD
jgi:hypothetical protein